MYHRTTVGVILFVVCLWPPQAHAWKGKQDNKATENLAQMKDSELCAETRAVCTSAAVPGAGMAMEGLDYLASIRQAVQKKHGQADPPWLTGAVTAVSKHTPEHCPRACARVKEKKRKRRSAAAVGGPAPQEPAPTPPPASED